jgi:hypothetical protein
MDRGTGEREQQARRSEMDIPAFGQHPTRAERYAKGEPAEEVPKDLSCRLEAFEQSAGSGSID